ncbi:hypothetical protein OGATHE_006584 [Ogataea polymorpha]|uniref:Uncharacterized protein n=1 Tax=Ogataea polymorpha TaxID=460523 RepID=A0A9P8NRN7_9ASCO|nr:hypothetical protein OGATHE_006584 [Ogataea polymorpha]
MKPLLFSCTQSVTKSSKLGGGLRCSNSRLGSSDLSKLSLLLGVVLSRSDLTLLFQSIDDGLVFPSNRGRKLAQSGVLSAWLQSQNSQGLRNNNSLLLVVWRWNTFKHLQSLQSSLTSGGLVGDHTSDSLVQNSGWGSEMERSSVGVESSSLSQVVVVLQFVSEEFTRDVESLTSHNDNLLAVEKLLGNSGGQSSQQVSFSVNDNNLLKRAHLAFLKFSH